MAVAKQDVPNHFTKFGAFQDAVSAPLSKSHVISQALHVPLAVTHVNSSSWESAQISEGLTEGPMSELRQYVTTVTVCQFQLVPMREVNCMLRRLQAINQCDTSITLPGDKADDSSASPSGPSFPETP